MTTKIAVMHVVDERLLSASPVQRIYMYHLIQSRSTL